MKATDKLIKQAVKAEGVEGLNRLGAELSKHIYKEGEASTIEEANKKAKEVLEFHMNRIINQ